MDVLSYLDEFRQDFERLPFVFFESDGKKYRAYLASYLIPLDLAIIESESGDLYCGWFRNFSLKDYNDGYCPNEMKKELSDMVHTSSVEVYNPRVVQHPRELEGIIRTIIENCFG